MKHFADPTLPGLPTALDVSAVHDLLRRAFPELTQEAELVGVIVQDVRYVPNGPCWILYRLRVRRQGTRAKHAFVSAQVLRTHEEPTPVPSELLARFHARQPDLLETPMAYLSAPRMSLYAFPLDSALPWLFDVLDPAIMRRHLGRLWEERPMRIRDLKIRTLGYTPRARAAFLLEFVGESLETGVPEIRRLIAKTHAIKAASALFASSWALWRAAGSKVNLAPPVGYVPAAGLTLQEQIRGERLGGLTTVDEFVKRAGQTARAVAALHALPIPLTTRRKPEDEVRVVRRWAGTLEAIRPDMARRIEGLRDRIATELEARTCPSGPVHGDFHHTNVLVQEKGVAIIDLDEMAYGDPLLDVGRLLASLRIPSLRAFGSLASLADAGGVFLSEYLERAGGDEKRVRLFEAATLFTTAASAFRIQRPNWEEEVVLVIDEVERVLQKAGCTPARPPKSKAFSSPPAVADPDRWARDGVYMRATLDSHVRRVYGAELSSCRVVDGQTKGRGSERYDYHLRGRREGARWSVRVQGVSWPRTRGGGALLRGLETLRTALEGVSLAPHFPRPVAFLRQLSLVVWEPPAGVRFSSLLSTEDGVEAAARVAASLAALHGAEVELNRLYLPEEERELLRRKVAMLETEHPELHRRARWLLSQVEEEKARQAPVRLGPTLRTVHPHHILLGEGVAFAKVESLTLAHPLLDVGDFLARLALLRLNGGDATATAQVRDRFVEAYAVRTGGNGMAAEIEAFEAGALLRLACAHAKPGCENGIAERLLERAEATMAGTGSGAKP